MPFVAGAIPALGSIFEPDTISDQVELVNIDDHTFFEATAENPITIQAIRIQQSGTQSDTDILCGTHSIAHNYGVRDYSLDLMNYVCRDTFMASKTGAGDKAFISVSYLPYNYASASFLSFTASSSLPIAYNTIDTGQLFIIFTLIILIFINIFNVLRRFI